MPNVRSFAGRASGTIVTLRLSMSSVLALSLVLSQPAAAQSEKPAKPPATEQNADQPAGDTKPMDGSADTPSQPQPKQLREKPERAPQPGCPAIGEKLELLV